MYLKTHYASGWSRWYDWTSIPAASADKPHKGLIEVLEKWSQSNEEKVLMHYGLLTGCDYYTMKGVGPVASCKILIMLKHCQLLMF